MSVQMTYTGPTGDVNYDVARDTDGPAKMVNGETYEVSEKLAERLLLSSVWKAPTAEDKRMRLRAQFGDDLDFLSDEQMNNLSEAGFGTLDAVASASDEELVTVEKVGGATVEKIREATTEDPLSGEPPETNDEEGGST